MSLPFSEKKATQVAALLLKKRGGQMSYLKLIKLLYLIDREALLRWGVPVTRDRYVSMDHGPVVSRIYELIREEIEKPEWSQYISAPREYHVALIADAPTDLLSRAEEKLIDEIYQQYGHWNRWKLRDYAHTLPEWNDPHGSSSPISITDILHAGGEEAAEIKATIRELNAIAAAQIALARS